MPPDREIPGTPQDWLARARSDLAPTHIPLPKGSFFEDLCFLCPAGRREVAEGGLCSPRLDLYDLDELLTGLRQHGLVIPPVIEETIILTSFAWEARYPGLGEPVSDEEYREAIYHADAVVKWAGQEISI